ncbi:MAG: cyclodeaminase/cyclohydrolase family protein [Thermoleophilia bacterium]
MEHTLMGLTLEELEARVASMDPTPGGGSVSALGGSLGASLGAMVWRLTQAKTSSDLPEERLDLLTAELEHLASALRDKVDEDAAGYDGVLAAMRLPKGTDEEKSTRAAAIAAATRVATEVPLDTAGLCSEVMDRCLTAVRLGHGGAVTDAGVGLLMAFAGLRGALYNVEINLGGLADEEYAAQVRAEAASLLARAEERLQTGNTLVGERIAG